MNKKYKALNRKILLFVDNFSGHVVEEGKYENVQVKFFPPNMTSIVQPLDQGIIHAFKTKYRRQMLQVKLDAIGSCSQIKDIDVLDAINFCIKAWEGIKISTIANCFRKAGFKDNSLFGACS